MSSENTSKSSSIINIDAPYGSWKSDITSQSITAGSVRLSELHYQHNNRKLFWLEGRPQEGGRNVLCCQLMLKSGDDGDDPVVVEVTPKTSNVRTRVHEYGGGAVTFTSSDNDTIFFSEFTTQQLCQLKTTTTTTTTGSTTSSNENETANLLPPKPITPDGNRYRFADGVYDPTRNIVICVCEDHGDDDNTTTTPGDVQNTIVAVDVTTGQMKTLVEGYDFCASPRLSPNAQTLACVVWNHPNMPWDSTTLLTLSLPDGNFVSSSTSSLLESPTVLAGGDSEDDTSIIQPLYHPQTGQLFYISDRTGYYNIYRSDHPTTPIIRLDYDFGDPAPGWRLGQQGFTFLHHDEEEEDNNNAARLVATFNRNGKSVLLVADVVNWDGDNDNAIQVEEFDDRHGLPTMFGSVQGTNTQLFLLGGNASTPTSIYKWNMETKQPAVIIKSSSSTLSSFDTSTSMISIPRQIEFPTTSGTRTAFGYYYGPKNDNYHCTTESAPPLLVKAHGGPTACTSTIFNPGIQYWTSRGFAVLDVDYGGSTGYGREYRRRLRGNWGIVDIDDVCNGATYLVDQGLADGNRLCIDGGSAGGYTTLGALAFRDVFSAGCSLYGVGDLTALAGDTHKFESRYLDGLVGEYPKDEKIYKERSPIESVASLSCPILLLQGDEDKIVPPNQAQMMHESLLKKGIPTCLKMYKGEQHGFRKAENIEDALDSELAFYGKVFGIDIPDAIDLKVDNM